jgi:3-hydroxybutyryl-CoA dehydratase
VNPFGKPFEELATGESFTTRGRTISEGDIERFAALTWDIHPLHTDDEWANESRFGGRIAHGMLLLSFAAGLMPFDPDWVVALRGLRDATFKAPVRPGDTIRVEVEVTDLRELDAEHGLVSIRWRVLGAEGKMAARATVEAVWRRGDAPAAANAADEDAPEDEEASDKSVPVPL